MLEYESHEPMLEYYQPPPPVMKTHVPALIIRWAQLRISRWVDRQLLSDIPVPVPVLTALFSSIFVGEYWAPMLPSAYWEPIVPHQPLVPRVPTPIHPQPPPVPVPAPPAAPADSRITNERFNAALAVFRDMAQVRTRNVYQRVRDKGVALPTRVADGKDRCLAYHVKGMYNARCGRSHKHTIAPRPPPAAADDATLVEWCQVNWHA